MIMRAFIIIILPLILAGCVGSPVASTLKYDSVQSTIKHNNRDLLSLKIGMTKDEVHKLMGDPERSEGYDWGSAWLYRTAMTSGIYGTADSDFTPVVFDQNDKLAGWGRDFFTERVKQYELQIK
jgi:outer membrane protein assembly factor BamE (lipoprotein component of BamABCDE complex)